MSGSDFKKGLIPFVIRIKKNTMTKGIRPYPIPILELGENRARSKFIQ